MAILQKALKFSVLHLKRDVIKIRMMGHYVSPKPWNYLWKPGPYPRTEEERIKAAKKYGLIPEDYEPYPEDEQLGDYPKLKMSSVDDRPGLEYWDMPLYRRNFGEPLQFHFDAQTEQRSNLSGRMRYTPLQAFGMFLFACFVFYFPFYLCEGTPIGMPMTIQQMPRKGDPHVYYTFEPAEE